MCRGRQRKSKTRTSRVGGHLEQRRQEGSVNSEYQPVHCLFVSVLEKERGKSIGGITVTSCKASQDAKLSAAARRQAGADELGPADTRRIRQSVSGRRNASPRSVDNFISSRNRQDHAMRLDGSVIAVARRRAGPEDSMAASRSAGITRFGPSAGKSGASSCAYSFAGRSGRERFFSSGEEARGERRRIAWRRRCTRIHSAMRAWISTSTNSSMSSMMRPRSIERSLRRAS